MSAKPARPPGVPWVSAFLTVRDAAAALAFYEKAFGFSRRDAVAGPDGAIVHAELTWHDAFIMLGPEGEDGTTRRAPVTSGTAVAQNLYVYCADVDALYARATAAGARGIAPPRDTEWGDRMCVLLDPDGHQWNFATHLGCGA